MSGFRDETPLFRYLLATMSLLPDVAIEVTPEIGVVKFMSRATYKMTANPSTYDTHVWGPEFVDISCRAV